MTPEPARHEPLCPPHGRAALRAGATVARRIGRIARRVQTDTARVPLNGRRRIMRLLEELGDLRAALPPTVATAPPLHPDDLRWMRQIGDVAAIATARQAHAVMDTIEDILDAHR